MKLLCKLSIHNWDEWKLWKWSKYETEYRWEMQMCERCGLKRYRKLV